MCNFSTFSWAPSCLFSLLTLKGDETLMKAEWLSVTSAHPLLQNHISVFLFLCLDQSDWIITSISRQEKYNRILVSQWESAALPVHWLQLFTENGQNRDHIFTQSLAGGRNICKKPPPPPTRTIKRLICGSCFIIRHYVHEVIKNHCFPNFLSLSFPSKKQNKSVPSLEPVWLSACRGIYRNSAFDCLWYHKSSPASLSPKLLLTTSRLVITVAL